MKCQAKAREKYLIKNAYIYISVLIAFVSILYFYRFHFFTLVISYVLGCFVCYFGLESCFLRKFLHNIKTIYMGSKTTSEKYNELSKGCVTCGSAECMRHDGEKVTEPWVGLRIHKQLDQAIEDFYNAILERFVRSWYSEVTGSPFFLDELRHQLRYASACLVRRALKINYSQLITNRLFPCALHHYSVAAAGPELLHSKMAVHPAAASRKAELKYLRCITSAIMPYLLKRNEVDNSVFRVLVREIFSNWVLLPLTDALADPYILNKLVILATGDETMAALPTSPSYTVEFLDTFTRHTDTLYTQRCKLLNTSLDFVLNDQDYFYAFMQFMKSDSGIHLLQFYKDIKSFQTKLLNPDLTSNEQASLLNEAWDIFVTYFEPSSPHCVHLDPSLSEELKIILKDDATIKQLQTSRALYQAARQSHAILEKIMLPKFLHSEEFYNLMIGSRIPTGYQKPSNKKQEKILLAALRLGNKMKNSLKPQILDGTSQSSTNNSADTSDSDSIDNIDVLKYVDNFASEDSLQGQDLSQYKIVLTHVEVRMQPPPRRGPVRIFWIAVHRCVAGAGGAGGAQFWSRCRSEHDFHLLRAKLHEFHGEQILAELALPSRRDNSPLETLRYKYEDFLQRVLQKSLLQTSELLHLFLTVESDFSLMVQASTMSNSTDFANIYQSVTHKLRKEKGQHLESFLRNFVISSDVERIQALKQNNQVEEAQEVNEDINLEKPKLREDLVKVRYSFSEVFGDNFGVEPSAGKQDGRLQDSLAGFRKCCVFLLSSVLRVRPLILTIVGSAFQLTSDFIDEIFDTFLNRTLCRVLEERTLAHFIRLGHDLLFNDKDEPREDIAVQRQIARKQLVDCIPSYVPTVLGTGTNEAVLKAFEIVQSPALNKQLVYNLLDLCLLELFPELVPSEKTEEPKKV